MLFLRIAAVAALPGLLLLGACSPDGPAPASEAPTAVVLMVEAEASQQAAQRRSATVRARHEVPLSFQVGGRVLSRQAEPGQAVRTGQRLFALDGRDFEQSQRAAQAQLGGADAALASAQRDLSRQRELLAQGFVSKQALERFELAQAQASSARAAAAAGLAQAANARAYTELKADRNGVLVEVLAQPGQVVQPGQTLALLAQSGERDLEVFVAEPQQAALQAEAQLPDGRRARVLRRELAAAADPLSRSWRVRYRLPPEALDWPLGELAQIALLPNAVPATPAGGVLPADVASPEAQAGAALWQVPLGALDERGAGPRVWQVRNGQAQPLPVRVLSLGAERAQIEAAFGADRRVVAVGVHSLTEGLVVRERAP